MLRCTSTLSITTWKNSGETRAELEKDEATSSSRADGGIYGWRQKPVMSKRREALSTMLGAPQDEAAIPNGFELSPRIASDVAMMTGAAETWSSATLPRMMCRHRVAPRSGVRVGQPLPLVLRTPLSPLLRSAAFR
jgi:hypothetical protein